MAEKNSLSLKWFHPLFSLSLKNTPTKFHCVLGSHLCIVIKGKSLKMTTDFYCLIPPKKKNGGISRPLDAIHHNPNTSGSEPLYKMGVGVVVVAWHSPKRRIAVSEPPFLGDQKVAWFVHLIFFWNENRQKGKIMFNTWLIPKLYLYTKKWYCPQTDMENGRLWWLKIQVSSVTIRHIFRHLSSNTTFWKQCFECLHTLHINDVPHKALNAWFFARAREREGCGCFLGTSWKSYRAPFFMGWWPTSFTLLYDVRVCHHTKGTTISIKRWLTSRVYMVVHLRYIHVTF